MRRMKDSGDAFRIKLEGKSYDGSTWVRYYGPYANVATAKAQIPRLYGGGVVTVQKTATAWEDVN
jgi:hypothetical protein